MLLPFSSLLLTTPCLCTVIWKAVFVNNVVVFICIEGSGEESSFPLFFCKDMKSCLTWFKKIWFVSRNALLLSLLPSVGTMGPSWGWRVPKSPTHCTCLFLPATSHRCCAQPFCPITGGWIQSPGCHHRSTSQPPQTSPGDSLGRRCWGMSEHQKLGRRVWGAQGMQLCEAATENQSVMSSSQLNHIWGWPTAPERLKNISKMVSVEMFEKQKCFN